MKLNYCVKDQGRLAIHAFCWGKVNVREMIQGTTKKDLENEGLLTFCTLGVSFPLFFSLYYPSYMVRLGETSEQQAGGKGKIFKGAMCSPEKEFKRKVN